jgi:hypothetical protein
VSHGTSKHVPGVCVCKWCVGVNGTEDGVNFEPGNDIAMRHGALASATRLAQDPATITLADGIRASMPSYAVSDEVTIELLAITMRRVERATAAIDAADSTIGERPLAAYNFKGPELKSLRDDLRGWIRLCASLADSLGMSPLARSRLGLNVVRARGEALRAHLLEHYDGNGQP